MFSGVKDVDGIISRSLDTKTFYKVAISSTPTADILHAYPINLQNLTLKLIELGSYGGKSWYDIQSYKALLDICRKNIFIQALQYKNIEDMSMWELLLCRFLAEKSKFTGIMMPNPTIKAFVFEVMKSSAANSFRVDTINTIEHFFSPNDRHINIWRYALFLLFGDWDGFNFREIGEIQQQLIPEIKKIKNKDIQQNLLHSIKTSVLAYEFTSSNNNSDIPQQNTDFLFQLIAQSNVHINLNALMLFNQKIPTLKNCYIYTGYFNDCRFIDTNMDNTYLEATCFKDCLIENISCNNLVIQQGCFNSGKFSNVIMRNIDMTQCKIISAEFNFCQLSNLHLQNLNLTDVMFEFTTFQNIDFTGTRLNISLISGCNFSGNDMRNTTFDLFEKYHKTYPMMPIIMIDVDLNDDSKVILAKRAIFTLSDLVLAIQKLAFHTFEDTYINPNIKYFYILQSTFTSLIKAASKNAACSLSALHEELQKCSGITDLIDILDSWNKKLSAQTLSFFKSPSKINIQEMWEAAVKVNEYVMQLDSVPYKRGRGGARKTDA